jgi:very-short-patch-repair endonuclease/predicted GIY-YIG superfamily endonuclease
LVETARELRKKETPAESIMWELLRDRRCANLKFRRQHQIGEYIADFFCDEYKLVVELDGPVHDDQHQSKKDRTREAYLQSLGLTVIRLRNEEFLSDPEAALNKITAHLPAPLGRGAGGEGVAVYRDIPGFCKAATLDDIRKHGHVLTPGRYVGAEAQEDDLPAPRPGVYFIYAIACEGDSYYIGHTDNLPRRWQEHVSGKGADWTEKNKPRYIAHYEEFTSLEAVVAREQELKTTAGRRWLKEAIAEGRARQAGGEPFEDKMKRLTKKLKEQFAESARLEQAIHENLAILVYGINGESKR